MLFRSVKSVPNALAMFIPVLTLFILENPLSLDQNCRNSIAMAVMTLVGFLNLAAISIPYTKWRAFVVGFVAFCLAWAVPVSIFFLKDMFAFSHVLKAPLLFGIMLGASTLFTALLHTGRILITRKSNSKN